MDVEGLRNKQAITEVDDFKLAKMIVEDLVSTAPELQLCVIANWVARLRETYVEIGKDLTWE